MRGSAANTIPSRGRPLAIVVMLSLALALIGVLGWQSWRLQQSNAATADSVLREYGILVADEFGRRAIAALGYQGYYSLVSRLSGLGDPKAMETALEGEDALARATGLVSGFFVVRAGTIETDGYELSPQLEALLERVGSAPGGEEAPYFSARTPAGDEQVIYAVRRGDNDDGYIAGFVVDEAGIGIQLGQVFDGEPLLPTTLAGGRVSNEMLFARVTNPAGTVLFEANPEFDSRLTVEKALGADYQGILEGFVIEVSLDPAAAESLIIGGLPASRLPMLVVVMVFVVALMLAAIWLFRREQAVMQLRADFVSQVSHELRTPLTQLRMFAETLLLDRVRSDEEKRRSLEIINRESQRLSQLVENILCFSNISDAARLERRPQPLAPVVREVCDMVRGTADSATLSLEADESACADIDADALRQILLNLLDNAIKYGPAGQEVRVSLAGNDDTVRLCVEDQGPGIPDSEHRRVWLPFYRLQREQDTAISGTGIGLSVVQELVRAMEGRCWIESTADGTRVCTEFGRTSDDSG